MILVQEAITANITKQTETSNHMVRSQIVGLSSFPLTSTKESQNKKGGVALEQAMFHSHGNPQICYSLLLAVIFQTFYQLVDWST